jgi:NAD(P)-dependent dehydrogenase (short-subunit alcohol dehydrogenase family)
MPRMEHPEQHDTPAAGAPGTPLAGTVAIVTGASRGIGRATAAAFSAAGAAVALAARDAEALAEAARAITAAGGRALAVPTDVADEAAVAALFARVTQALGPVGALVNAAGALANVPFAEMDAATWDRVLGTNLRGMFLCCRAAFRQMAPRGGGVILNIASLSGMRGVEKFPGLSAYTASKFGVAGLTESLAVEGRPLGIRVLAVSPGAVDTAMLRAAAPHLKPGMTPDELARILVWLAGPDARPLSGSNLEIFSNG